MLKLAEKNGLKVLHDSSGVRLVGLSTQGLFVFTGRNVMWTLPNQRPMKLREQLKECEVHNFNFLFIVKLSCFLKRKCCHLKEYFVLSGGL